MTDLFNSVCPYRTNNMFVPYRVAVREFLQLGANVLLLTFQSAYLKVLHPISAVMYASEVIYQGKVLEKQHGKFALWNGDSSRLHVRKAQYK